MKLRNIKTKSSFYGIVGALLLSAGPASADQADSRLTVAFISDAAQASAIVRKQYDRAIEKLEDAPSKGLRGFYAANNLCVAYLKVGDAEQAQVACDTAVQRIEYLLDKSRYALRYATDGDYQRLRAIALSNRGVVNFVNDKPELARADFESAIQTEAGIREPQINLARLAELATTA